VSSILPGVPSPGPGVPSRPGPGPLSRRQFLRAGMAGAGAIALGALAQACGSAPNVTTASSVGDLLHAREAWGDTAGLQVSLGGKDYVSSGSNYVALFLTRPGAGGRALYGADARVWVSPSTDPTASVRPSGPVPAPYAAYSHPDGPPPLPQGLNAATLTFVQPGIYTLVVETTSGDHLIGTSYVQVNAPGRTDTLIPGDRAYASVTPTTANPEGVNPICTRNPPCPMHAITLADAISNGKPTAFIIATPEFCQSRNCGPSLDEVIAVQMLLGSQANFVHAEVYQSAQSAESQDPVLSPTVKQWGMTDEPWLFLIDRTGVIQARFEGGFTAGSAGVALKALLG
jgi:hypothetical protein